ncbi:OmpA family protein [Pontibacillus yanchengensis]|uniref:Membrane protein n=1 Tax=Pontibacillus yanchengensis Y32 TaxID=1385514 RepID=A0A0A2TJH0_9BACI|nr:OmpA family protein [Pontibacillus yanchengensis]KGP74583.1 membrane protein [Pontibacillus yanchengensis Y32]
MNNKYKRLVEGPENDNDFWPSFTDLLATFLLVVLLILIAMILNIHKDNVAKGKELNEKQDKIEKQEKEIEEKEQKIAMITGLRKDIIVSMQEEFKDTNLDIEIDKQTGAIKFSNDLLFETGKSVIRPEFKQQLKQFIPVYMDLLYSGYEEHLSEIVVEGHTDNVGSFMDNLDLSQQRAFSVTKFILSDELGDFKYKDKVKMDITANGRSETMLKKVDGVVDKKKSRRVEFKFRLKNYSDVYDEE